MHPRIEKSEKQLKNMNKRHALDGRRLGVAGDP
jgi:hypothetical protein